MDLSLYDIDKETEDDYLLEDGSSKTSNNDKKDNAPAKIRKFPSSPAIDFTACRYSSEYIVVLLWTGFVISYVAYFGRLIRQENSYRFDNACSGEGFGCLILVGIVEWLFILATLFGFGLGYLALSSIGNGIEDTRKRKVDSIDCNSLYWFLFMVLFFLVLYQTSDEKVGEYDSFDENGNPVKEQDIIREESEPYEAVIYYISLIIGNIVILLETYMILGDSIRKCCFHNASAKVMSFFTSSGIKAEAGNKRAAALKFNSLVNNARQIHAFSGKDVDHGETFFGAGQLFRPQRGF